MSLYSSLAESLALLWGDFTLGIFSLTATVQGRVGDRMKERLRAELRLTPEQVAKISPIVDKTAAQLQEIRRDTGRRVHGIMAEAHKEIAVNLTDEQRQRLQQIEERHRRGRHRHGSREFAPESPSATP